MIPIRLLAVLGLASLSVSAQVIISDDFNITGDDSTATGFGPDGVNTEIATRLTGQAASDESLEYTLTNVGKPEDSYSITGNRLEIEAAENPGVHQLSADGAQGFDFGSYLVGKTYEIRVTMDNDSVDTVGRRMSLSLGSAPRQLVNGVPLGLQLRANPDQTGAQVYKRVSGDANPDGGAVNELIADGLPYGEPVDLRVAVTDVQGGFGATASYEIYINGASEPADSGIFGMDSESRYLIFDVAPLSGPVTFDDLAVEVTGDAPEPPEPGSRHIYFIGNDGEIRGFTGFDRGNIPITAAPGDFRSGMLEATHAEYALYQAFTFDPTSGLVYGINEFGDVVTWPSLEDWLANTDADAPEEGDPAYEAYGATSAQGSVHGASYDPDTGGFYVVYEGDASIDGDLGEYANADDFLTNSNATVTESVYGGNILNFYYWGDDAPATREEPNNTPGAQYFQASGAGQLEGFLSLADYTDSPQNRTYGNGGFCTGCVAAFAVPFPPDPSLRVTSVQRNGSGEVTDATLEFSAENGASYTILGSPDLETPFEPVSGFDDVTTSPITVTVPSGFDERGFFLLERNP